MPFVHLQHSPLAGGPADIYYREFGSGVPRQPGFGSLGWSSGRPLIFLHGGWGYGIYPLSQQQAEIPGVRVIVPDRSGYGQSTKSAIFNTDFHRLAVGETLAFMDALGIDRPILWGHSDGAVISAWMGILHPERCLGIILEALHYYRNKPHSHEFFTTMMRDPDSLGERVVSILKADHGDNWRDTIRGDGKAWLEIAALKSPCPDLYQCQLSQINVPLAVIHGQNDPRTEPGELDRVRRELPNAEFHVINAGHSPHSERASQDEVTQIVRSVLKNRDWH